MKIRALIVDDEALARERLASLLASENDVEVIGQCANGVEALAAIQEQSPELVFLDVQMPGLTGTEVLRRIERQPYIIFTTAFAEHAVTAFELGAVDYLLKPFGPGRLSAAMDRVRAAIGEPATVGALERLTGALGVGPISRLFIRVGGNLVPLPVGDVTWFEADGD